jgi:hypothetical protein
MSWTKLGDLFVMPMRTDEIPEVWISRDLLHWTRVTLPSAAGETLGVTAVTIGGPGLVAIGEGFSGDATVKASWTSTDGMTWTRVQDAGLTAGQMWLLEATANGEVTFASGRVDVTGFQGSPLDSNVGRRTLVASEGGVTAFVSPSGAGHSIQMWQAIGTAAWRRVALLPHSSGATGLIATQGPRGWLLLGGRRCCTGYAVWTSADGIT